MNFIVPLMVVGLAVVMVAIWLVRWQSTTKEWCVMMYFVARNPHSDLDPKLEQVLGDIRNLPCASKSGESGDPPWKEAHVLYRAIWKDPSREPEARVVHWRPFAPKATTFAAASVIADLSDDLHEFFNWAYSTCPARHYAVFFWGHSFGPGGIFEVNQPIVIDAPPQPLLAWSGLTIKAVARSLNRIVELRSGLHQQTSRRGIQGPLPETGPGLPGPPPPPPPPSPPPPSVPLKVEAVLFQDCWMSTLETMYTLENSVRYVVGSQSLVPIGLDSSGLPNPSATWPYKKLIDCFLTQPQPAYADGLLQVMRQYFDSAPANRYPDPSVPCSLLDLGDGKGHVSAILTVPFQQFVSALGPLGKVGRGQLIESKPIPTGRFYKFDSDGHLRVGDVALIDVITLCDYLQKMAAFVGVTFPPGQDALIKAAAANVQTALLGDGTTLPLVRGVFESVDSAGDWMGFKGVSVLYKGDWWPDDATLMYCVNKTTYEKLTFAQNAIGANVPTTACWMVYAFEHSRSDSSGLTCT